MLFLLLTTAFASGTWHREEAQDGGYATCLEINTQSALCAQGAGPALTALNFVTGACPQSDACPEWVSTTETFINEMGQLEQVKQMLGSCSDFAISTTCSGTVPNPGNADLSGCDLTGIDIQNCVTCVPTKCDDFKTQADGAAEDGCASCLSDCMKAVYEDAAGLQCDGLIELPNLDACQENAENPLACVAQDCDMFKCSSYEQFGCASCVTECVTTAVEQSFKCDYAEQITSWAGANGFQIPTGCDVSCITEGACEIPTDCNDYATKVSEGGCASCLGDCARRAVASSIDGCEAVLTTWSTTNFDTCSSTSTASTDVASCVTQNCAMPKDCNDYENAVSSGGCANCLSDCARTVVAQSITGCEAILNLGNNNGSAGALSLVLALVGSILYHF